jgi:hypothetical protein
MERKTSDRRRDKLYATHVKKAPTQLNAHVVQAIQSKLPEGYSCAYSPPLFLVMSPKKTPWNAMPDVEDKKDLIAGVTRHTLQQNLVHMGEEEFVVTSVFSDVVYGTHTSLTQPDGFVAKEARHHIIAVGLYSTHYSKQHECTAILNSCIQIINTRVIPSEQSLADESSSSDEDSSD